MKMCVYSAVVMMTLALFPCLVFAQATPQISIDCNNISIKECAKQLPFVVAMDPAMATHNVMLRKITTTPLDGLRLMLDDSGITNYVISFDEAKNSAAVSYLSNKTSGNASAMLPNGGSSTIDEGNTFSPSAGGGQPQQVASSPGGISTEELKELVDKANAPKTIDPDEEISLLGGEKVTLRQLQARQERADVSVPAGDLNLSPVAGGERLTYDDLKAMKMRYDAAAQEVRGLTLLNGVTISPEDLKSLHALGQTTEGATKGFYLQNSPSLPSGPGLITVEQ